jgi:hypothetical protein
VAISPRVVISVGMPLRQAGQTAATFALLASLSLVVVVRSDQTQPVRVNVRWTPETTDVDRRTLERRFSLTSGTHVDGATWRYLLANHSSRNIEALVTEPRVEDTYNIDRAAFRPIEVPWKIGPAALSAVLIAAGATAVLVAFQRHLAFWRFWAALLAASGAITTWPPVAVLQPQVAMALSIVGALLVGTRPSSARQLTLACRRSVRLLLSRLKAAISAAEPELRRVKSVVVTRGEGLESWASRPYRWGAALTLAWGVLLLPAIAVGPWDVEEYYTGVVTTKVAMEALLHGSWPFWSLDFGLGVPQPLRFHFIFHPMAPLCVMTDCAAVLRSIASLHILVGALCMGLLTLRLVGNRLMAMGASIAYCLSSSVVQTMLVDDWPITGLNESALPVLLYALLALGDARDRGAILLWTLILGGAAGVFVSGSFPLVTMVVVAIVALATPALRQRFPWLVLAAAITLLIGGAQIHHIFEQVQWTSPAIARRDHAEPGLMLLLWSAFLRPLPLPLPDPSVVWRTAFVGPPFAIAAMGAWMLRGPDTRPLRVGLTLGLLGLLLPPAWLMNVNTAQWSYRTELNVFGILLGAYAIHYWTRDTRRQRWLGALVALQLSWMAVAVAPTWLPVLGRAIGLTGPRRVAVPGPAVTDQIAALYAARPGRVVLAPIAQREQRRRSLAGLVPNQLQMAGIPAMAAIVYGVAADELYPTDYVLESQMQVDAAAFRNKAFLDILGARYIVSVADDVLPTGMREIRRLDHQLRIHENPGAWPEAFFVDALPTAPVPRLAGCSHDRFLCADFARYDLGRRLEPLHLIRLRDGVRLTFPSSDSTRHVLLTHWYRPGWMVTEGRASVSKAAEQLVGLRIEPNETLVELRYRPGVRSLLFVTGLASEVAVVTAVLCLVYVRSRRRPAG